MKMVKSLILGSAATLLAVGGAQAADLPVKAKPVEYVKVCSLYGAGFFYIPGTDSCIKIGGYMWYEAEFGPGTRGSHIPGFQNSAGLGTRDNDQFFQRARTNINFDVRQQTEYGVLRAFTNLDFFFNTSNGTNNGAAVFNVPLSNNNYGNIPANIFVQFAGFTLGKATPVTSVPWSVAGGYGFTADLFGYSNSTGAQIGQLQAVYTADLGNGLSITGGIADATYSHAAVFDAGNLAAIGTTNAVGGPFGFSAGASSQYGQYIPDFVGNVTLNQAWGGLYFGAIVHDMSANYYNNGSAATTSFANGHPDDAWAWGIEGSIQIKNLPTGTGDQAFVTATYGDGMIHVSGTPAPTPTVFGLRGYDNPQAVAGTNWGGLGWGQIFDGVFSSGGQIQKTKSWGIQGAYDHWWVPGTWRTSIFGGYASFEYNAIATATLCASALKAGLVLVGGNACNFDIKASQIGSRTSWFPVKNLQLDLEVMWSHFDFGTSGNVWSQAATSNFMPAGTYGLVNQNVLSGAFRAVRNF